MNQIHFAYFGSHRLQRQASKLINMINGKPFYLLLSKHYICNVHVLIRIRMVDWSKIPIDNWPYLHHHIYACFGKSQKQILDYDSYFKLKLYTLIGSK